MYERLLIARDLLREDGVIFISIDDNEVHNLRHLCDEVFGERNFVGSFIKQSKVGGGSDSKHIANEHEYIIVYSKDINILDEFFEKHDETYLKRYKEKDEKGRFFWDTFARPGLKNPINYDIEAPDGTIINGDWIWSKKRFEQEYQKGNIRIIKLSNGKYSVQFKQYLNERGKKPRSMSTDFGGTFLGKKDILQLFQNDKIFSYPKSVFFMKKLVKYSTSKNDLILDFFSGSATTAHAVMELNAEDGGNRQYIMVQIPEKVDEKSEAYKAGYKTICDIGRDRIIRASEKIKSQYTNNQYTNTQDFGFRYFKADTSNFKEPKDISEIDQSNLFEDIDNIKPDRSDLDLLFEVILNLGLELSLNIKTKEILEKTIYFVDKNLLIACFDENIDENLAKELAEYKPLKIVLKDSSFVSDSDKINFEETIKELSPENDILVV
jgi:adenine-specific DNA-methyltransferase